MRIKTYVVNLKESVQRRESMLEEVSRYPFMDVEFIEAVNGTQMSQEELEPVFDVEGFTRRYGRAPLRGEIGCTLSHRKCYETLLASDQPYALILEDDVLFRDPEETEFVIGESVELLQKQKRDIMLFTLVATHYNRPHKINDKYTAYPVYSADGTYAYLISRAGAERLLKMGKPTMVADDFHLMRKKGARISVICPNIAYDSGRDSIIGDADRARARLAIKSSRLDYLKNRPRRIFLRLSVLFKWMVIRGL